MTEQDRLDVFRAQTKNVRELENSWKHLNRQLNVQLLANNAAIVNTNTKLLALLYCALAEAIFSKIIHTPKAFSLAYIDQIKGVVRQFGIKAGWVKCVELGMQNVKAIKSGHGPNVQLRLDRLITAYIFDPSLIRNKLAHGQWDIALNRENDSVNTELTAKLNSLNVIALYRLKDALSSLAGILEDIIESPNKAHMRDYWPRIYALQNQQHVMSQWTLKDKLDQLKAKADRAQARGNSKHTKINP